MDLDNLLDMQIELIQSLPKGHTFPEHTIPSVIAGLGFMEEICEYMQATGLAPMHKHQPDYTVIGDHFSGVPPVYSEQHMELADSMFFYLELMFFGNFSLKELMDEVKVLRGTSTFDELVNSFDSIQLPGEYIARPSNKVIVLSRVASSLTSMTFIYLNTIGYKSWRPYPLDKAQQLRAFARLTVVYAELIRASEIQLDDLTAAYTQKWAINKKRWQDAKEGEYGWDDRDGESI